MTAKEVEGLAEQYAEEQNSAYTNDMYGFIAGFEKCIELAPQGSIEVLKKHNLWRQGGIVEMPYSPKELTEAIDNILNYLTPLT